MEYAKRPGFPERFISVSCIRDEIYCIYLVIYCSASTEKLNDRVVTDIFL